MRDKRAISLRAAVLIAVATVVVATGSSVLASHQFVDVPDTHTFHDEISAMSDAGITGPFPDGTFRPSANLTRQAMAAFLERGLGRVGRGAGSNTVTPSTAAVITEVTLDAGASRSGKGYVHLTATANAQASSNCPCTVIMSILTPAGLTVGSARFDVPGANDESNNAEASGTAVGVAEIGADKVQTYRLIAQTSDSTVPSITISGSLTALYVPFGPDADQTAAFDFECPADDGYEQNDTQAAAASMIVGRFFGSGQRGIACPDDDDYFRFSAGASTTIDVVLMYGVAGGDVDLYLLNSAGTVVASSESKDNDDDLSFNVTTSGVYTIRVHLHSDAGPPGNAYTLFTRNGPTPVSGSAPVVEPAPVEAVPE